MHRRMGALFGALCLLALTLAACGQVATQNYPKAVAAIQNIDQIRTATAVNGATISENSVTQRAQVDVITVLDSPYPELASKFQVKFNLAIIKVGQVYALPLPRDAYNKRPVLYIVSINGKVVEFKQISIEGMNIFDPGVPGDS